MAERGTIAHPNDVLLGTILVDRRPEEMQFESILDARQMPLLRDHQIDATPVLPAAAYLHLALAAAECIDAAAAPSEHAPGESGHAVVENAVFHDLLAVPDGTAAAVRVRVMRQAPEGIRFEIESAPAGANRPDGRSHVRHADGAIRCGHRGPLERSGRPAPQPRPSDSVPGAPGSMSGAEFYARANRGPYRWGPTQQVVQSVQRDGESLAYVLSLSGGSADRPNGRWLHPSLLDGCLQVPAIELSLSDRRDVVALPSRIDRIEWRSSSPGRVRVQCRLPSATGGGQAEPAVDLIVFDAADEPVMRLEGVHFRLINREAVKRALAARRAEGGEIGDGRAPSRGNAGEADGIVAALTAAPRQQRHALLAQFIAAQVAELLKLTSPAGEELQRGFFSIGLDSLLAIELQFRIQKALDFTLPPSVGLTFETIDALARYLLDEVLAFDAGVGPVLQPVGPAAG